MKNIIISLSILLNIVLLLLIIREKGGWKYVHDKFSRNRPVISEHQPEYRFLTALYESMPRIHNSIVFVGNSLTRDCNWAELFQNVNIRNRGIGGDCAAGVLQRIDEILDPPPVKIFFELGLSDMARGYSHQDIVGYYEKIINISREHSPSVELFIQSVLPVRDGLPAPHPFSNSDIVSLNEKFKILAQRMSCTYIDLHPRFLGQNGEIDSSYTQDGVHLTSQGYAVWKSQIAKYIK